MADIFSVSVKEIVDEHKLEVIYAPKEISEILVYDNDCNRPGLQLMGFYEYFLLSDERLPLLSEPRDEGLRFDQDDLSVSSPSRQPGLCGRGFLPSLPSSLRLDLLLLSCASSSSRKRLFSRGDERLLRPFP